MPFCILVINPGATSTKIAVFRDGGPIFQESIAHGVEDLKEFPTLIDQVPYRKKLIEETLIRNGIDSKSFDAVVGRGGLLAPLPGGVYEVSPRLLDDARSLRFGEHASNMGPVLADGFARGAGCRAYVVDPVSTDEWAPIARISGLAGTERICHFHALNHKAVARLVASEMGRPYEEVTFIVVHLGTGVSVGVHSNGKVTDVNDAMNEGTFSLDRAGGVPALSLIDMCYSGEFSHNEMLRRVNGSGGVYSYLGTKDMREVEARVSQGDEEALKIVEAFAYQIAKDIGAMAAVCRGKADLIIITGGMAHYRKFVDMIVSYVDFIAPIKIVPGEEEMGSLAEGAFRVLGGIENAKFYSEELQKFDGQLR